MRPDNPREEIASFQEAFLELLSEESAGDALHRRLTTDPRFSRYRDQVARWDVRMLAVAAELLKKWGVRSGDAVDDVNRGDGL